MSVGWSSNGKILDSKSKNKGSIPFQPAKRNEFVLAKSPAPDFSNDGYGGNVSDNNTIVLRVNTIIFRG